METMNKRKKENLSFHEKKEIYSKKMRVFTETKDFEKNLEKEEKQVILIEDSDSNEPLEDILNDCSYYGKPRVAADIEDSEESLGEVRKQLISNEDSDSNEPLEDIINDYSKPRVATDIEDSKSVSRRQKMLEKAVFGNKEEIFKKFAEVAGEVEKGQPKNESQHKSVWCDRDDDEYKVGDVINTVKKSHLGVKKDKYYNEFLREKFEEIQGSSKWVDLDREKEYDSDEEILLTVGHKSYDTPVHIPPNIIQAKRLKDVNRATYAEKSITSVQFLPSSTVALVAGMSGVATLYAIDGVKNEKLHNFLFKNFPIKCVKVNNKGTDVFVGGVKNFFYTVDLIEGKETRIFLPRTITKLSLFDLSTCGKFIGVAGRFGEVHVMDQQSKELIHTFKQENPCTSLQFSPDSSRLFSHSSGSEVTIYNLKQEKIEHVFTDEGCISGNTISISPNQQIIATGSKEGVVNLYNYDNTFSSKYPNPDKVIYNLTTAITATKFNHSSEILGICSSVVKNAMKLVHFPSCTVYANFPGEQANFGYVTTLDFSPHSGFMALGNRDHQAPLFRLRHFNNY